MFGALGSWEGPQTLELMFGDERARGWKPLQFAGLGFAVVASLILLFVIKKDLE